jgi:four helix bundle protein
MNGNMPPRDLQERTRLYALAVVKFCRKLPATSEADDVASQLRRAANAVRSNYRAARKGRSRAEFEAKLGTVWEEADEAVDWMEHLRDAHIAYDAALFQEGVELAKIFAQSIKTAVNGHSPLKVAAFILISDLPPLPPNRLKG